MALSHRPGTVRDGLIYYHDTGNKASFKGKPTVNLCPIDLSNPSWVAEGSAYTRELQPQKLFGQPVYRFQSNPAKIWESPFAFNQADIMNQDTTVSAYFYNVSGATSNVNMYYGKDFSLDSNGDSNNKVIPSDGKWHRVSWTMYAGDTLTNQLEFRTHHPNLLISCPHVEVGRFATPLVNGERSSTNSLLDMVGGTQLDTSNISFDSEGMFFDGTDDGIIIPTITLGNGGFAVEAIIRPYDGGSYSMLSNSSGGPVTNAFGNFDGRMYYRNYDGSWQPHYGHTELEPQQLYHLTWVNFEGNTPQEGTMKMYVNGVLDSEEFPSYTTNGGPVDRIGGNWFTSFNGEIPLLKIYRKSLSEDEISQNFNLIKDRFAL